MSATGASTLQRPSFSAEIAGSADCA